MEKFTREAKRNPNETKSEYKSRPGYGSTSRAARKSTNRKNKETKALDKYLAQIWAKAKSHEFGNELDQKVYFLHLQTCYKWGEFDYRLSPKEIATELRCSTKEVYASLERLQDGEYIIKTQDGSGHIRPMWRLGGTIFAQAIGEQAAQEYSAKRRLRELLDIYARQERAAKKQATKQAVKQVQEIDVIVVELN